MATRFEEVQIERVRPNEANIREDMGDMEALTAELKTIGIRNPLLVYPHPTLEGDYLVQDGHRRLQAARDNGALFVPCLVIDAPKRGLREDIEVMLSTGRAAKVLNPLEVSFGFEQLVADGMDETTIGKKYKIPKSEVKTRARIMAAAPKLQAGFAAGQIDLVAMKRIQDLEDGGQPGVLERVVEEVSRSVDSKWGFNVENIIAKETIAAEREAIRNRLVGLGAVEGKNDISYDGKHDKVTDDMTEAKHAAAGHLFAFSYNGQEPYWYAKRVVAKVGPTAEELEEKKMLQSLDAGLAIQGRVRRKFAVDQVLAKDGGVGAAADFDLVFDLLYPIIRRAGEECLAALSGIAMPADPEEPDDVDNYDDAAVMDVWRARVEKKFRTYTWGQLARAAAVARDWDTDTELGRTRGFDRDGYGWRTARAWYSTLQTNFGYRLDESERNAILWAELKGGVSSYSEPDEGSNRRADEDLVIIDGNA
jgi:ParB family transcriptional regulator, chromosome partitioning protein